jgi:hypothetical protein
MKNTLPWRNKYFLVGIIILSIMLIMGCTGSGDHTNPFANNTEEGDNHHDSESDAIVNSTLIAGIAGITDIFSNNTVTETLLSENFDGTFPPAGWSVTNDNGGPVVWHRSDVSPKNAPLPSSGYSAYAESYPAYCGYSYDTSLVSPSFSTVGMDSVELLFDYQYWVYSTEYLAIEYRIGGGPWINLQNLSSNGGYTLIENYAVDISVTKGNSDVQLRWRYYNLGSGCDWWTNIDDVQVTGTSGSTIFP